MTPVIVNKIYLLTKTYAHIFKYHRNIRYLNSVSNQQLIAPLRENAIERTGIMQAKIDEFRQIGSGSRKMRKPSESGNFMDGALIDAENRASVQSRVME